MQEGIRVFEYEYWWVWQWEGLIQEGIRVLTL